MGLLIFRTAKSEPDTDLCWESQGTWIVDAENRVVRTVAGAFTNEMLIQSNFYLHEQASELQPQTFFLSLDKQGCVVQVQGWEEMGRSNASFISVVLCSHSLPILLS